jgi:exodeoxyribonuclease III
LPAFSVATWNVNSVRSRLERLLSFLERAAPDVLLLQELKCEAAAFPTEAVEAAGYRAAVLGQKTYNGVAVLSRSAPADVQIGFGDPVLDEQARLITARVDGVRVASVYVPNGRVVGSEAWEYKLDWLERLRDWLDERHDPSDPLVIGGDFNVALDDRDVAKPARWNGSVLYHPDAVRAVRDLLDWGLVDTVRLHHTEQGPYTWWDYRALSFPQNDGLRIDHLLATAPLASRCTAAHVDRDERKGEKPSDHAPVVAVFE